MQEIKEKIIKRMTRTHARAEGKKKDLTDTDGCGTIKMSKIYKMG